ncbi:MAG: bifunctional phosphoglucose/phosphomannose isomerase [Vicingaceae bacterium]
MKALVKAFSDQIQKALTITDLTSLIPNTKTIQNVLIGGLGGSGIGGTIVKQLVKNNANVPIETNKDYDIPNYVDHHTLVIASSYSGNTEETLEMVEKAQKKGAEIVCITSGGKLKEIALKNNYNYIEVPGGIPPRAAFGYTFPQLFYVLKHYGIITVDFKSEFIKANQLIATEEASIQQLALNIAKQLLNKTTVVYSPAVFEGLTTRFRQQLNENAKELCWNHVVPEMNHNELVGWRRDYNNLAVVFVNDSGIYFRVKKRMEIVKEIVSKYTDTVIDIETKGDTIIQKAIYLIHLFDWISVYLADLKQIDPVEINVINYLKEELGKI